MADEVENQKRALLSAIAQQGAFGREQFAQNNASLEQGRTGAMDASFARSDQIHAPQALNTALGTQAAQPFDAALRDQQLAALAYDQQIGGINTLNSNYMGQVQAARPVVSAITDSQIARIRAQQEEERLRREAANKYEAEDREWMREQRNATRAGWKTEQDAANAAVEADRRATDVQNRVNSSGLSGDAKDSFNEVVGQAGDFGTASQAVAASKAAIDGDKSLKQAEKDRRKSDLDALLPYLREYYGITYSAPAGGPAPASAAAAPKRPGFMNQVGNTLTSGDNWRATGGEIKKKGNQFRRWLGNNIGSDI